MKNIQEKFIRLFDNKPLIVEAPGRINLIGEHTDYNDGFVLPAAIDKKATFAIALNNDSLFRFYASDLDKYFETKEIKPAPAEFQWANYLLGVLAQFKKQGVELRGVDCVFESNIPIGAGLSSSAAIECGFAFGLNELFNTQIPKYKLALMAQKAEHEYAGVMCGIMDQYASMFGMSDHVFRLDCRTHEHAYFSFEMKDLVIVLCDTQVKHELASSEYNTRREECDKGVQILKKFDKSVNALRDADTMLMEKHKGSFDPITFKRCQYVVKENERVLNACDALEKYDFDAFGKLMYQSHDGLQHEYEVSCKELDILVDLTREIDFVYGARMMGGGFGGCTINLVKQTFIEDFKQKITDGYRKPGWERTCSLSDWHK